MDLGKSVLWMVASVAVSLSMAGPTLGAPSEKHPSKTAATKVAATKSASKSKVVASNTGKAKPRVQKQLAAKPVKAASVAGKRPVAKTAVARARSKPVLPANEATAERKSVQRITRVSALAGAATAAGAAAGGGSTSFGEVYGLHNTNDPLALKSSVAFVMDQDSHEVLFSKNARAVLPIASITKLMTSLVVLDAHQPFSDMITVTDEDIDTLKNSASRLSVGATLTRGELLHLALMSSENRAAHALARTYPGGMPAFVAAMNRKANSLGMRDTHYADPTGLDSSNQSSARDLATLVEAAYRYDMVRELTTSTGYQIAIGNRQVNYVNSNRLVSNPNWHIGLQKTGFINEAGHCLVMQAQLSGRRVIMVFLDSEGKYSRLGDAERVRAWVNELGNEHEMRQPRGDLSARVRS